METLIEILNHNPQAEIVLDTVYLRTLSVNDANQLIFPLSNNKDVLQNIIFLDSFSKSHGLCRERVIFFYFLFFFLLFLLFFLFFIFFFIIFIIFIIFILFFHFFQLGMYFSYNEKLFTKCHESNIAFSAGPGVFKDYQFTALGNMNKDDKNAIREVHEFWRDERKGCPKTNIFLFLFFFFLFFFLFFSFLFFLFFFYFIFSHLG